MKVAVAGKGGAGKTTVCATAARLLARSGRRVVAIDGDANPNLAAAIGADASEVAPVLAASLVSRRFDGPRLTLAVEEVLARHATAAPDGVSVLRMGMPQHAEEGCMCSAHAIVSALLADLGASSGIVTLLDLEASPEHLSRGTARHCDVLVLVAEPYYRSLEAVRLQASLAKQTSIGRVTVLANKCRRDSDLEAIDEYCVRHGLDLLGALPWSEAALDADAAATPLLDHSPRDGVVTALGDVLERLISDSVDAGANGSGSTSAISAGTEVARPAGVGPREVGG